MTVGVATNSREMSNYYHFDSGKDGKLSAAFDANFTKVRYFKSVSYTHLTLPTIA